MSIVIVPLIFHHPVSKAAEVQLSQTNSAPLNYVDYSVVYSAVVLENSREPDMFLDGRYHNCPPEARRCTESVLQQTRCRLLSDSKHVRVRLCYYYIIIFGYYITINVLASKSIIELRHRNPNAYSNHVLNRNALTLVVCDINRGHAPQTHTRVQQVHIYNYIIVVIILYHCSYH